MISPLFNPDEELFLRIPKILIQLKFLSFNKKHKPVLTVEKIVMFDFLVQYPEILNKLLITENKKTQKLLEIELHSIEAYFPNRKLLFDFSRTKTILNILYANKLIEINLQEGKDIVYSITNAGIEYVDKLDSLYFNRLKELFTALKGFQSSTFSKLNSTIHPYINYGFRD